MTAHEEKLTLEALLAHQGFLAGLARHLVDNDPDADDLVQDAWVSALQGPAPRGPNLRAWLGAVVRNRWRNQERSERARAERERSAARVEAVGSAQAERGLDQRRRVIEAVRSLPEPYLTTIYLRYYEERPIADVAARTGVPPETARSRIQRGIELLRAKLDREFGSRGSWMAAVGAWWRPDPSAGPALPGAPLAGSPFAPLGWIGAAGLAASALLVVWIASRPGDPPPGPDAPLIGGGSGSARQEVSSSEPGVGGELRSPVQEVDPQETPASVATARPDGAAQRPPPVPAREPSHQSTTYLVRGRVLGPTGTPAAGAEVYNSYERVLTDEEGRFELEIEVVSFQRAGRMLAPRMQLIACLPGHHAAVVPDLVPLLPEDPSAPHTIELVLGDRPRTLSGKVETADGQPAAGWRVCLRDPTEGTFGPLAASADRRTLESLAGGQPLAQGVDPEGSFVLEGLFDRPYDVIAWHPESLLHVVAEAVPESVPHIVLQAPDPSAARRVAGRVASRAGVPLAGARISGMLDVLRERDTFRHPISVYGRAVEADEQGYFEFPEGFLGPMRLRVDAEGVLLHWIELDPMRASEDWEQLELLLPVGCEIVLDTRSLQPPSDLLAFENGLGHRLQIRVSDEEAGALGGLGFWRAVFLGPGPSRRVIHTSDDAVTALFFDHDGAEIERRPIQLVPGTPLTLTW